MRLMLVGSLKVTCTHPSHFDVGWIFGMAMEACLDIQNEINELKK